MSSSMTMMMTATSTGMPTTSSVMAGGHSMEGMESGCKISMLWNWYTIDACFISSSWQIKNNGMFAASCIGVALLVVSLEFLRRISKEYDNLLLRQCRQAATAQAVEITGTNESARALTNPQTIKFRASPLQQLIRATLHALTFGVAYIIMLLAMYYNGYFIISIFIGAGLGKFLCDWLIIEVPIHTAVRDKKHDNVCDEPTVCCG